MRRCYVVINKYFVTRPVVKCEHVIPADGNMAEQYVCIVSIFSDVPYTAYAVCFQPRVYSLCVYVPTIACFSQAIPDGEAVITDCVSIIYIRKNLNYGR